MDDRASFSKCSKLVLFAALKLQNLSSSCFYDCSELKIVITPNANTGNNVFWGCKKLDTLLILPYDYICHTKNMQCCGVCPKCRGSL